MLDDWIAARAQAVEAGDHFVLLLLAAVSGDVDGARAHAARVPAMHAHAGLGLLELGLDRPEAAILHLLEIDGLDDVRWHGDLIESQIRAGRKAAARATLARFAADRDLERCRGLLAAPDEVDVVFARAGPTDSPFERARTELCWGERLRRDGRRVDARRHLHEALRVFTDLGAPPWAAKATRELRSSGGRTRRGPRAGGRELTAQEAQITAMVAEGRTNKNIAGALFLSPKTIEFHLAHVFRKLEVSNRTELARAWLSD